jgi:hypothetical protein
MLVYHKGKTVIPLNRLLNPFYAASHPAAVLAAIRMLARLNDLDNAPYRPDILYITLEKFRSVDTIDLCDAETCVKVHLSPDGEYIPSCIFNVMHRPQTMEKNARDGSATGCQ